MKTKAHDAPSLLWLGAVGAAGVALGAVAWALQSPTKQPSPREPRSKDDDMARAQTSAILGPVWPIPAGRLRRVGESVMARRAGSGRPHKGVDLFAEAGSPVLSAAYGRVLRVVDGRTADPKKQEGLARAGLFVDVRALSGWVYRYLHLGSVLVREGEPVRAGQPLGTVSPSGGSGVEHSEPHVHFEIRAADWDRQAGEYGEPVDPLQVLPPRERVA